MPEPIYTPHPDAVARSQMTAFTRHLEAATGRALPDYAALHAFSVAEPERFWAELLAWLDLAVDGDPSPARAGDEVERAVFFPNVRLSYVDNLLRSRGPDDDDQPALTACDENGARVTLTRGALRDRVLRVAAGLAGLGVGAGDRVVAMARNDADAVVACLATAALGAIWSSTPPDLAADALLDRFRPLEPAVFVHHGSHPYHGSRRSLADKIAALAGGLPTLRATVSLDGETPGATTTLGALAAAEPLATLPRFGFNHPLFILFSSGTTGPPKCIVHGAGGTLLEHHKEHRLHSDLGPGDKLYFHCTVGWMMWNWQLSALACGTEIVLYDGSVSFPEADSLWRMVAAERVTVFGTSPAYLQYSRDAGIVPKERGDLGALRAMQSTGSVLADAFYPWVRDNVAPISLQSISGGTDIIGCFVLGNPNLPVYEGESQCISLGLDVREQRPDGTGGVGELVCASPFPSRPLGLWGDPDGRRFHDAYFAQHAGVWTHGDFLEITPRGGARILGRSDGVMNIRGIRIGPAEIYGALAGIPEIAEAMALEQAAPAEPGGARLVLLVVLRPGVTLDRPLSLRIKKELRERRSMAHVPAVIADVAELPTTHNGKRSERAARDAVNRRPAANLAALRNPACLAVIAEHSALRQPT